MAVRKGKLTEVGKAEDKQNYDKAEEKVKNGILDSMDLSKELENAGEVPEEEPVEKEVPEEEEEEEEESEEEEEDEEESDDEDEEDDEEDDEVISKSKVQKRINKLIADNKILQQKLAEKEEEKSLAESNDPDTAKLHAMDEQALRATRKSVIKAIRAEDDDDTLDDLLELQDKVDTAIRTLPDRFVGRQVAEYNKVADHIVSLGEIPQTEKTATELKELARGIYQSTPALKKLVEGQGIALNLAYQHYKTMVSKSDGKDKTESLTRQVNSLKRKTALDSSGVKKKGNKAMLNKLRDKAERGGSYTDKTNLIKADPRFNIDSLIPEEYREG